MGHNTLAGKYNVTIAEIQSISMKFQNIKINTNNIYVFTNEFITELDYSNLNNLLNSREKTNKQDFANAVDKLDFIAEKLGLK